MHPARRRWAGQARIQRRCVPTCFWGWHSYIWAAILEIAMSIAAGLCGYLVRGSCLHVLPVRLLRVGYACEACEYYVRHVRLACAQHRWQTLNVDWNGESNRKLLGNQNIRIIHESEAIKWNAKNVVTIDFLLTFAANWCLNTVFSLSALVCMFIRACGFLWIVISYHCQSHIVFIMSHYLRTFLASSPLTLLAPSSYRVWRAASSIPPVCLGPDAPSLAEPRRVSWTHTSHYS